LPQAIFYAISQDPFNNSKGDFETVMAGFARTAYLMNFDKSNTDLDSNYLYMYSMLPDWLDKLGTDHQYQQLATHDSGTAQTQPQKAESFGGLYYAQLAGANGTGYRPGEVLSVDVTITLPPFYDAQPCSAGSCPSDQLIDTQHQLAWANMFRADMTTVASLAVTPKQGLVPCDDVAGSIWTIKDDPTVKGGVIMTSTMTTVIRYGCSFATLAVVNTDLEPGVYGSSASFQVSAPSNSAGITWSSYSGPPTNGSIVGHVYDATSGNPIMNASITIPGASATTDASGAYQLAGLGASSYLVTAAALGHGSATAAVAVDGLNRTTHDFTLARTVQAIQPLSVVPVDARAANSSLPPPAVWTTPSACASLDADTVVGGTYYSNTQGLQGYVARLTAGGRYKWSSRIPDATSVGAIDTASGVVDVAAQDSSGSFVAAYDGATGNLISQSIRINAKYQDAYVAAVPGGGAYLAVTYRSGSSTWAFIDKFDSSGANAGTLDPGGSAIGVDGAYAGFDGSLFVGIRTASGTTIHHYVNGVADPAFSVAVPSNGLWAFDHSTDSLYVAGRSSAGDTLAKYDSTTKLVWSNPTSKAALVGSGRISAMVAGSGAVYFAWKAEAPYRGTQTSPTVALSVADGADGFNLAVYKTAAGASGSAFNGYDLSITGLSVSGTRASVVGTTDPYVFADTWATAGGKWPSLESVAPYGFLSPFSVYGNNGSLQTEQVQAFDDDYVNWSVGLDSAGNTYTSEGSPFPSSSLVKHAPDGSVLWQIPRPSHWGERVKVVESGPHAGVYVAGLSYVCLGCNWWQPSWNRMGTMDISEYSFDGQLLWSATPSVIQSDTSTPTGFDFDVRADGTVFFENSYQTVDGDPRGAGKGVYMGIAGPLGITGSDQFCVWGACLVDVVDGRITSTPDGSQFYAETNGSVVLYNQDFTRDTSFRPIPLDGTLLDLAVDSAGSLYVFGWPPSTPPDNSLGTPEYPSSGWEITKYNSSGIVSWNSKLTGDGLMFKAAMAVAGGRVYVVESRWYPSGADRQSFVDVWSADSGAALDQELVQPNVAGSVEVDATRIGVNAAGEVVVLGEVLVLDPSLPVLDSLYWDSFRATYRWTAP
jgi:hypothetical protein